MLVFENGFLVGVVFILVLALSKDGMGKLKMHADGIQLSGDAFLLKDVYANRIKAPQVITHTYTHSHIQCSERNSNTHTNTYTYHFSTSIRGYSISFYRQS